jgi:hypothetical protein
MKAGPCAGPIEDLHDMPETLPALDMDSLDPKLWGSGDAHIAQQSS